MNKQTIDQQLQHSKIREGMLLKRSKFLKEWRERWVILTLNYIVTFSNKACKEMTDVMDLRAIKSYKSYLSKSEQMIPAGFKLRSGDSSFYLCAKNVEEKWSWIVSIERLVDYKGSGPTSYNNLADIRKKGFPSQQQCNDTTSQNLIAVQKAELINAKKQKQQLQKETVNMAKKIFTQQQELEKQKLRLKEEMEQLNEYRQTVKHDHNFENILIESRPISQAQQISFKKDLSSFDAPTTKKGIVDGIFEQFTRQSEQFFGFRYYIDFMVNICSDARLSFRQHFTHNCKTHKNNKNFTKIFVQFLGEYEPITLSQPSDSRTSAQIFSITLLSRETENFQNWMKFINLILIGEIIIIFSQDDLLRVSKKLKYFLLCDEVDSSQSIKMILEAVEKLEKVFKVDKEEIRARLEKIVKLSKKEEIAELAKKLLAS